MLYILLRRALPGASPTLTPHTNRTTHFPNHLHQQEDEEAEAKIPTGPPLRCFVFEATL